MSSVIEWIRRRPNAITASTLSRLNKIMGFHDANLMVAEAMSLFPHGYATVSVEHRCCTSAGALDANQATPVRSRYPSAG